MTNFYSSIPHAALVIAFAACASPAPAVAGTPNNATSQLRNADAAIDTTVPVEWPQIALEQGASGTAVVRVDLRENGTVQNAAIFASTGNKLLDEAARAASLKQKYSPEVRDCLKIDNSYLVSVGFHS